MGSEQVRTTPVIRLQGLWYTIKCSKGKIIALCRNLRFMSTYDQDAAKRDAALQAIPLVQDGMLLGIGTGSTVKYFIEALGKKVQAGLRVKCVPTSHASRHLAEQFGIPLTDFSQVSVLDLTVDGADEIDPQYNLIKGGGGALFREKVVAKASDTMVVIADQSKKVDRLGQFPLPVEVVPFGWEIVQKHLTAYAPRVECRMQGQQPFVTDNGNYILDCHCGIITDPAAMEHDLKLITGVVEVGLFVGLAQKVFTDF